MMKNAQSHDYFADQDISTNPVKQDGANESGSVLEVIKRKGVLTSQDFSSIEHLYKENSTLIGQDETLKMIIVSNIMQAMEDFEPSNPMHASTVLLKRFSDSSIEEIVELYDTVLRERSIEIQNSIKKKITSLFTASIGLEEIENALEVIKAVCGHALFMELVDSEKTIYAGLKTIAYRILTQKDEKAYRWFMYDYLKNETPDIGSLETSHINNGDYTDYIFEQRLSIAEQLYQWEQKYWSSSSPPSFLESKQFDDSYNTYLAHKLENAGRIYTEWAREALRAEQEIFRLLKLSPDTSPEEVGRVLYASHTGKDPAAKITIQRKEGYFIMHFFNEKDYKDFTSIKGLTPGGTYHRSFLVQLRVSHIAIRLIAINEGANVSFNETILQHERQHFLNDQIDLPYVEKDFFTNPARIKKYGIEQSLRQYKRYREKYSWNLHRSFNALKDEYLAFMREGRILEEIEDVLLKSPLYAWIFKDLTLEERTYIENVMRHITVEASNIAKDKYNFFRRQHMILVYSLLEVPFPYFPSFFRLFKTHLLTKAHERKERTKHFLYVRRREQQKKQQHMLEVYGEKFPQHEGMGRRMKK